MAIALAISGKPPLEIDAETITIGSDPAATIALTDDDRIKPRHAVIRRAAGRWLVEAREGDSIQVGDSEPARVHWLNAGDVIHLVENGPDITFQPPGVKPASSPPPAIPVAAAVSRAPVVEPPPRPPETIAPAPLYNSLFAPLTEPTQPSFPAPREAAERESAVARTPAVPPPKKPGRKKSPSGASLPVKNRFADPAEDEPYKVAEEPSHRLSPVLRRGPSDLSDEEATSQAALGWMLIWVVVGLGVLLIIAVIWFGGGAANGDDRMPDVRVPGVSEIRNSP